MQRILRTISCSIALVALLSCGALAQDSTRHAAAVAELLSMMSIEKTMEQAVDISVTAQLKANPNLVPYEAVMRSFLSKYMGWAYLKDKFIAIYMAEFTEAELRTMIAFYRTDTGKKVIEKLPSLMAKGSEMGQRAVQDHMNELTEAIQKRSEELNKKE